jgi:hypothetical protein
MKYKRILAESLFSCRGCVFNHYPCSKPDKVGTCMETVLGNLLRNKSINSYIFIVDNSIDKNINIL